MRVPRPSSVAAAVIGAAVLLVPMAASGAASAAPAAPAAHAAPAAKATSDTSPVNLSNTIDMAAGKAAQQATVVQGNARFEVLTPGVVRMEYAASGSFLDDPTFTILNRDFTPPPFTSSVSGGVLTITTSALTLTYQVGSGAFSSANTQLKLLNGSTNGTTSVSPYGGAPAGPLGGYIRAYDAAGGTYTSGVSCGSGQSGATCQAPIPKSSPGVLDTSGWYLLDDTHTAAWTSDGWLKQRPAGGDTQDGYVFGYGRNYASALQDLAKLTGPTPMLPEATFGNWFSHYHGYSADDYKNTLLPAFAANGVTLDDLSVDTNWKSPSSWNGLEWNNGLFPDPQGFLNWTKTQDLNVGLNIHASVSNNDALYGQAQDVAGNTLQDNGSQAVWDWGDVAQAESYFDVQDPTQNAADFTWLDWCCDNSTVSTPGVAPDSWINYLTARQKTNLGERGYVLSRIGASYQTSTAGAYASGPWAEHRSAIGFTGDTSGTWNTLASQAQLTQAEGSVGFSYVSDDIGSFLGSGGQNLPDDLYLRWLQLGTFQPIMREHSDVSQNERLPWAYDSATKATGDQFLQLRSQLVPYLYTLSSQVTATGLPMAKSLYLDYPDQADAYTNPGEYLLGSNMLVAPVTTPGSAVAAKVWFPPGTWQDYFTGASFTGPGTQTIDMPTSRMPVFVKAGAIVPLQPADSHANKAGTAPLTLQVHAGGNGSFSLYNDAGEGLGYQSGQSTTTPIGYTENASGSTVTIGATSGSYPGAPGSRTYGVDLVDLSQPTSVQVNGQTLPASGWTYDSGTHTLHVSAGSVPAGQTATVTQTGGKAVQPSEPPVTIPPAPAISTVTPATAAAGQQVTLSGSNFGASQGSGYLAFSDGGTNWGAPGDSASFTVNSWSDKAITFTVPNPSGNGAWHVTPGSTATVQVVTSAGSSAAASVVIGTSGGGGTPGSGHVVGLAGKCMTAAGNGAANGTALQLSTCGSATGQSWALSGSQLKSLGKCADLDAGGTTNGTVLHLWDCDSALTSQQWVHQADGSYQNPASGRCIDVDNDNPADGTPLHLWDCLSIPSQVWTLPS
jgi:Glycosyl hydrolases family 31/Ricin-type beta-trefoil lectin domain/Domain of unknown function (DUF5110)